MASRSFRLNTRWDVNQRLLGLFSWSFETSFDTHATVNIGNNADIFFLIQSFFLRTSRSRKLSFPKFPKNFQLGELADLQFLRRKFSQFKPSATDGALEYGALDLSGQKTMFETDSWLAAMKRFKVFFSNLQVHCLVDHNFIHHFITTHTFLAYSSLY